jgi:hypothetical protein
MEIDKVIHQIENAGKIEHILTDMDISPGVLDAYSLYIDAERCLDIDVHFDSPGHRIVITIRKGTEGKGPVFIDDYD